MDHDEVENLKMRLNDLERCSFKTLTKDKLEKRDYSLKGNVVFTQTPKIGSNEIVSDGNINTKIDARVTSSKNPIETLSGNSYKENAFFSQLGSDIDGEAEGDQTGFFTALSSDGTIMAVSSRYNDDGGSNSGHVRVFKYSDGSWDQLGSNINGEAADDNFGRSIALSSDGTILAAGTPYNDGNGTSSGHVRVYQYSDSSWSQLGDDLDGKSASVGSGFSIDLSSDGTILVIGAPYNNSADSTAGYVRVYKYSDSSWTQLGDDVNGEVDSESFGYSVSISSDGTIFASGSRDNNDGKTGHVRVFKYSDGSWDQLGSNISGEANLDSFGYAVALSSDGTILAASTPYNDGNGTSSGHVRVYKYSDSSWSQLGDDLDGELGYDYDGQALAISSDGKIIAIGSTGTDNGGNKTGSVKLYQYFNSSWSQLGSIIDGEAENDMFGVSLSLSFDGTIVAAGAKFNDDNGSSAGHVRIFKLQDYVKLKTTAPYAPSVGASYFDTATDKFMIYNGSAWKSYSADT